MKRPWWRTALSILALLVAVAAVGIAIGVIMFAVLGDRGQAAAPNRPGFHTPTTYGPPGPSGGPR